MFCLYPFLGVLWYHVLYLSLLAILILKVEEESNIFGILCFIISRKVKTQLKCNKICAVYGEGAVTDRTCQK